LPLDGGTVNVGPFIISNVGEMTSGDVYITDLQVVYGNSTAVIPGCMLQPLLFHSQ